IEASGPGQMTQHIVFFWPFLFQECFRPAVPLLLFPIGPYSLAAMVPDHGCWAKPNRPALLLQPPADIHVIARRTKLGIKSPDGLQGRFPKRHVTPGDMLCLCIGEEHMYRTARGIRHTVGDRTIARGR